VDIEEAINLAKQFPKLAQSMKKELFDRLDKMNASYPYLNPAYKGALKGKAEICKVIEAGKKENNVWVRFKENGNKVTSGQVVYTLNGGKKSEEWYSAPASVTGDRLHGTLPKGATHYFFNLVDDKNFLVSHPVPMDMLTAGKSKPKGIYSVDALPVQVH